MILTGNISYWDKSAYNIQVYVGQVLPHTSSAVFSSVPGSLTCAMGNALGVCESEPSANLFI